MTYLSPHELSEGAILAMQDPKLPSMVQKSSAGHVSEAGKANQSILNRAGKALGYMALGVLFTSLQTISLAVPAAILYDAYQAVKFVGTLGNSEFESVTLFVIGNAFGGAEAFEEVFGKGTSSEPAAAAPAPATAKSAAPFEEIKPPPVPKSEFEFATEVDTKQQPSDAFVQGTEDILAGKFDFTDKAPAPAKPAPAAAAEKPAPAPAAAKPAAAAPTAKKFVDRDYENHARKELMILQNPQFFSEKRVKLARENLITVNRQGLEAGWEKTVPKNMLAAPPAVKKAEAQALVGDVLKMNVMARNGSSKREQDILNTFLMRNRRELGDAYIGTYYRRTDGGVPSGNGLVDLFLAHPGDSLSLTEKAIKAGAEGLMKNIAKLNTQIAAETDPTKKADLQARANKAQNEVNTLLKYGLENELILQTAYDRFYKEVS